MKIFTSKQYAEEKKRLENEIYERQNLNNRLNELQQDIWDLRDKFLDLNHRLRDLEIKVAELKGESPKINTMTTTPYTNVTER